jgi:hypothetical protein
MKQGKKRKRLCECAICRNSHDFDMPEHLLEELYNSRVVIFAGAGVSTENKLVLPYTLYDDVKDELRISADSDITFSSLMSRYCSRVNGRANLLRKIQERLNYIRSFPELYRVATRFHCEVSTLYHIDTFVTTNWDNYFESECGATPFVTAEDFTFWNVKGRKVFKIHGSVNNYGSIVATVEDYKKCYKNLRDGILGSTLKNLLATKTIIYVGYSFGDDDFKKIHCLVRKEMGSLVPHGYIVTLDRGSDARFKKLGVTPIYTDAVHFISILKQHAVGNDRMIDDERFEGIEFELLNINFEHTRLHNKFDCRKYPDIVFASSYQDGLIHSFERMLELKTTGYYSHKCNVIKAIQSYVPIRKEKLKNKRYWDVAYIDGYVNGLMFFLLDDKQRGKMPRYYVFGLNDQPQSFSKYIEARKRSREVHKSAYKCAERIVHENINKTPGLVYHHSPLLL